MSNLARLFITLSRLPLPVQASIFCKAAYAQGMGKGSGHCEARPPVLLGSSSATEIAQTALEAQLAAAQSYSERIMILHKMRALIDPSVKEPETESQRIDDELLHEIKAYPGQLRALFLERSLLRDDLLYVYMDPASTEEQEAEGIPQPATELIIGDYHRANIAEN